MKYLIIKNACLINNNKRFNADVLIKNKTIEKIDRNINTKNLNVKEIDAENLFMIPGLIDSHVHFREPGLTSKATIYTESRAAATGGITSFIDMPNTVPPTKKYDDFLNKCNIAKLTSAINYSFYVLVANDNYDEIMNLNHREVPGLKIFLGSSTGNLANKDTESIEKVFANTPLLILAHCEDDAIINKNLELYKNKYKDLNFPYNIHKLIRDDEACYVASLMAANMAEKYSTRLHIVHISTEKELSLLKKGENLKGKNITGEVCVHHLFFSEDDYKKLGNLIKWNPSIKSKLDKEALQKALRDNLIDTIATDHAPHLLHEKQQPYLQAPSGAPLVQHALPILLELSLDNKITMETIVAKFAHNVAKLFNIEKRGFLEEGYYADIALFSLHDSFKVDSLSNIKYKCQWSPVDKYTFRSKICYTIVNGEIIYDGNNIYDNNNAAMQLKFN